ncbi:prolipoprotein diacylglyceryl transferase [Mesobacterium pallidum]|uniref:prolipoprotein diacylglyceryl transferase n=1 Tax=Mesobacterium pallidum TaxID=2872037 RepID=UPI001EE1B11C|nr:prolipoprotein diacylglyceryl transferase [Mesobacterium pallidum]
MIPFPDISPEIVSITLFGVTLSLRWYAMAYIVGILVGWALAHRALKRPTLWQGDTAPMAPGKTEDLVTWIILGIILGGRLGYVLFYRLSYYLANPLEIPMIWTGGMSFHGGFLGVVIAAVIFYRRHGVPLASGADLIALAVPPGLLLGRLANFINAELWGRPTDAPWGVVFPGEAAQSCGQALGQLCARHPSQLYEAALEGLLLGGVLLWLAFRRGALKRPGLITGLFLAGYGLARFLLEFVRQPDAQFVTEGNPLGLAWHIGGWGLTQGQALSLPMIAVGLWLVLRARR